MTREDGHVWHDDTRRWSFVAWWHEKTSIEGMMPREDGHLNGYVWMVCAVIHHFHEFMEKKNTNSRFGESTNFSRNFPYSKKIQNLTFSIFWKIQNLEFSIFWEVVQKPLYLHVDKGAFAFPRIWRISDFGFSRIWKMSTKIGTFTKFWVRVFLFHKLMKVVYHRTYHPHIPI